MAGTSIFWQERQPDFDNQGYTGLKGETDLKIAFLREIMRFINSTSETSDIVRVYAKEPELAKTRLKNLLSDHSL